METDAVPAVVPSPLVACCLVLFHNHESVLWKRLRCFARRYALIAFLARERASERTNELLLVVTPAARAIYYQVVVRLNFSYSRTNLISPLCMKSKRATKQPRGCYFVAAAAASAAVASAFCSRTRQRKKRTFSGGEKREEKMMTRNLL